jgi:hypothetical protein
MGSALPSLGIPSKADMYAAALEGLVQVNGLVLDRRPDIPRIYEAGVRWVAKPHNNWRRADQIHDEGWGDCEGFAAWRTAQLRRDGEDPTARVGVYHTGPAKYHAIVVRGDDQIEDPSCLLGMRPRRGMPLNRHEMNAINGNWPLDVRGCGHTITIGDVDDPTPGATFIDSDDGTTRGQIRIPTGDGQGIIATTSPSADRATAAAKAANLLADVTSSIAKNPGILKDLAYSNPYSAAAVTLYSEPHINQALKAIGGKAAGLLRRIF